RDMSLDRVPDSGLPPLERIPSPQRSPEEEACIANERAYLGAAFAQIMSELSARERRIITERWLSDAPVTLEELGVAFGVSKERVRQIEERARRRIRERLAQLTGPSRRASTPEPLARSA